MAAVYQITYGTYVFTYATMDVTASVLKAEDGITALGTTYSFSVSGSIAGYSNTADFAANLAVMKCQLQIPRQGFTVRWSDDGVTFNTLYSFDNKGDDVAWGPWPGELKLSKWSGGKFAMYTWTLQVTVKECYSGACALTNRNTDVLATIFRFAFIVNGSGFTTRTVSGKIILTANSVQAQKQADKFRFLIVSSIPVPKNYQRMPQEFDQSADGRELSFRIVDQEQMWTLPRPISSGNATWMIRGQDYGLMVDYTLSGRFEAPANVSKSTILNTIAALAQAKFSNANGENVTVIPGEFSITEEVYNNAIGFSITARGSGGATAEGVTAFAVGLNTIDVQLPGYDGIAQFIGPYGGDGSTFNSGVIARAPTIYDSCNPGTIGTVSGGGGSGTTQPPGGNSPPGDGTINTIGSSLGGNSNNVASGHAAYPYIAYHEKISYEVDNGLKVFQPKKAGLPPIIQQSTLPTFRTIQAGYASRIGAIPSVPDLAMGSTGKLEYSNVTPSSPEPVGNTGYNLHTISWRFVQVYTAAVQSNDDLDIGTPTDPRVENSVSILIDDIPELVEQSE